MPSSPLGEKGDIEASAERYGGFNIVSGTKFPKLVVTMGGGQLADAIPAQLAAHGSWFMVHGSWFTVHGSWWGLNHTLRQPHSTLGVM
jgi:hypothetical protein